MRIDTRVKVLIGSTFLALTQAPNAEAQRTLEVDVNKVFAASPTSVGTHSHFPVPFIYSDWQKQVENRYGRMSLAQYNERLYEDLPPFKAEDLAVPENRVLATLIKLNPAYAAKVMQSALASSPKKPQWSIIAATKKLHNSQFVAPLINIAKTDPNATDRAFAVRALSTYPDQTAHCTLESALFDDSQSVRMLAVQLLGRGQTAIPSDIAIALPDGLINPFRMYFSESAFLRLLPGHKQGEYPQLEWPQVMDLLRSNQQTNIEAFTKLAEQNKQKTAASVALFVLGTPAQAETALKNIEKVLLEQGRRPDVYHSPDFFLRMMMISCFMETRGEKFAMLEKTFVRNVDSYSPDREMLLLAIAYGLGKTQNPTVIEKLASLRNIKTDNYDVYCAAASALAEAKSEKAFPSLIHILSLKREPFCTVATWRLRDLTGLETPGTPPDYGMLHNIGIPEEKLDIEKALRFWKNWYKTNETSLRFDADKKIFVETTGQGK